MKNRAVFVLKWRDPAFKSGKGDENITKTFVASVKHVQ